MKVIKIDIDGVLRDLLDKMCEVYNSHYNENIKPCDVKHFATEKTFTKCFEIDNIHPSEWLFQVNGTELNCNSNIICGAKESMDILHQKGYYIIIVSHQLSKNNKIDTLQWLDKHNVYYDSICFTDKKNLVVGDIIVDDNIDFLNMCSDKRKILIDAPYNKGEKMYERFNNLYNFVLTL